MIVSEKNSVSKNLKLCQKNYLLHVCHAERKKKNVLYIISNSHNKINAKEVIFVFGSKIKGELSTCCNAQVKRAPKLAGYKPYCTKCNKRCEIKKIENK